MKRLHVHVSVNDLQHAVRFYTDVFDSRPCCAGRNYANWRVQQPPVNFTASVGHGPAGALHLGLEVEVPADLTPGDRVLQGAVRPASGVPWEVSVRRQPIRKERTR
jgi:catechol 2,3-dioxygenase-like lactoylglutathione lyase family enzyme